MTLKEYIAKYGERKAARTLVSKRVNALTGGVISLDELPDTSELCDIVDRVEDELKANSIDTEAIRLILLDIDEQAIDDMIFS